MDQDLINYAQVSIPIHKLDRKWLWCEAWCDDDYRDEVYVIDFCTDPKRLSENKFERAKRLRPNYENDF